MVLVKGIRVYAAQGHLLSYDADAPMANADGVLAACSPHLLKLAVDVCK
jgi:hypothetical protein